MPVFLRLVSWVLLISVFAALPSPISAGPVTRASIIVPLGAGGALDTMARRTAQTMSAMGHRQIDVENLPAKDQQPTGYQTFLRRPADGSNLLVWFEPAVAASGAADFFENVAIVNVQEIEPPVLVASRRTAWSSLDDMVQAMQEAPGRFRVGVGGRTAGGSLLLLALIDELELDVVVKDFRSGGKARKALLRDEVDVIAGSAGSMRKIEDNVVPLAVFSPRRVRVWPDVPTIREGLGADVDAVPYGAVYRFVGVHRSFADTDPEAFAALVRDFEAATRELQNQGLQHHWFGPNESTSLLRRANQHFTDLIDQVGRSE